MEDEVYNGIDDYLRYVRRWVRRYDTPLTANSIKEYGSAVWNKWLAHRYGRAIIRRAWARAINAKPGGSRSPPTTRRSKRRAARTSAAISPASPATWPSGAPTRSSRRVTPIRTSPARAACRSTDASSTAGSTTPRSSSCGSMPAAGARSGQHRRPARDRRRPGARWPQRQRAPWACRLELRFKQGGGALTVRLSRPGRFNRLTAVLVNADTDAAGFSPRRLDWAYLTEACRSASRRGRIR